jgi:hypothetical protein
MLLLLLMMIGRPRRRGAIPAAPGGLPGVSAVACPRASARRRPRGRSSLGDRCSGRGSKREGCRSPSPAASRIKIERKEKKKLVREIRFDLARDNGEEKNLRDLLSRLPFSSSSFLPSSLFSLFPVSSTPPPRERRRRTFFNSLSTDLLLFRFVLFRFDRV